MQDKKSRRPVGGRTATESGAKNFSNPKATWPLGQLLVFLWMQNTVVLAWTIFAILEVAR